MVLVRAVGEIESRDGHSRPEELLEDRDVSRLGAECADNLVMISGVNWAWEYRRCATTTISAHVISGDGSMTIKKI